SQVTEQGRRMESTGTREFATRIVVVFVAVLALILGGAPAAKPPTIDRNEADAIRLLEQATWGPNETLIAHVKNIGAERFVDEQLATPQTKYTTFDPWPANRPATCVDDHTLPVTPASYCARDNYTLFQLQREFFKNA